MAHVRNTLGTPRWPPGTIPYPLHGACAVRGRRRPCATCRAHRLSHRTCVIYVDSKGKRKSLSMKASMKAAARTRIRAVMEERLPFVDQSTTTVEPYPKVGKLQGWCVTHRCSCSTAKGLQAKAHCGKTSTVETIARTLCDNIERDHGGCQGAASPANASVGTSNPVATVLDTMEGAIATAASALKRNRELESQATYDPAQGDSDSHLQGNN